jgi:hypothetical protein
VVPVTIGVGIGDTLQAIDELLARRESDRVTVWDSLSSHLEAVSLTVGNLDSLYLTVLAEIEYVFAQPKPPREQIDAAIVQASAYCTDGRLTLRLSEWRGIIQGAAFNRALKQRKYRVLASALRSIDEPLERYIKRLHHLQDASERARDMTYLMHASDVTETLPRDRKWDLSTVLSLLKMLASQLGEDGRFDDSFPNPREACEEAFRNYDHHLSLNLVQLIGHARQSLSMERL